MTNEQEWEDRIAEGRGRFLVPEYTIKDQYREPGVPFFAACYYIDAPSFQRIITEQAFAQELNSFARKGTP